MSSLQSISTLVNIIINYVMPPTLLNISYQNVLCGVKYHDFYFHLIN
jgi:hypothetical protein